MAAINYSNGINPLGQKWEALVRDTLDKAGIASILITSTYRTPEQQARAMYDNIVSQGLDTQYKLYGPGGDAVINEYVLKKNYGYGVKDILTAMARKIREIGPSKVSAHCVADPEKAATFDILPASIPPAQKNIFESSMQKISKILIPGVTTGERVYHVELRGGAATGLVVIMVAAGVLFLAMKKFI